MVGASSSAPIASGAAPVPSAPAPLLPALPIKSIHARSGRICALDAGDRIACWGAGKSRLPEWTSSLPPPWGSPACEIQNGRVFCVPYDPPRGWSRKMRVLGLDQILEVSEGVSTRCARRMGGAVLCWGNPAHVGNWSSARPARVPAVPEATAIAMGRGHACAISGGGAVWCWGHSSGGVCGPAGYHCPAPEKLQAPKSPVETVCATPVEVRPLPPARQIVAEREHTCVLAGEDTVLCWGRFPEGLEGDTWEGSHVFKKLAWR